MKEIEIRIGPDGKVKINVTGVKGSSCQDLTKTIEDALGIVENTQPTEEFYQEVTDDEYNLDY
jgi:hypothetical protein